MISILKDGIDLNTLFFELIFLREFMTSLDVLSQTLFRILEQNKNFAAYRNELNLEMLHLH